MRDSASAVRWVAAMRGTLRNQLAMKRGADFGDAGRRAAFVSSQIRIRANSVSAAGYSFR
jgi:hypothetical protein